MSIMRFTSTKCVLSSCQVKTEDELSRAVAECLSEKNRDNLCFIEIIAHKDDTSKELLEWGSRVSAANGRMSQILTE